MIRDNLLIDQIIIQPPLLMILDTSTDQFYHDNAVEGL